MNPVTRTSRQRLHFVGTILALALLLRVAWGTVVPVEPVSDSLAYDTFARNIALHGVYGWDPNSPTAYWPPGTSAAYATLYALFGITYWPLVMLHVVASLISVALSMALAGRWLGSQAALGTGALLAVWPWHIQFTTILASEQLFTAMLLAGIASWEFFRDRLWLRILLAGLLIAAACYVRPTALLIPVVLLGLDIVHPRTEAKALIRSTIGVLGVLVVIAALIAPWTARNTSLFGQVVLISTNGGANLWMGNNPKSDGTYMPPPHFEGLSQAQINDRLKDEALAYIHAEPITFVKRTAIKSVRLHDRETIGVGWNERGLSRRFGKWVITPLKLLSTGYWYVALACSALGWVLFVRRKGLWCGLTTPPVVLWGYFAVVHAVIVIQDRYHFQSTPFVAMLASVGIVWTIRPLRDISSR